jgi:putative amino-acid transport system permease protein
MSETMRGAIRSVDKGQMEGCLSVGMTYWQAMKRIVLPQALHYIIPPLSNNFLEVFKGTSLASMVGITEMMLKAKMMSSKDLRFMETYLAILFIYWGLNIIFSIIQKYLEVRISSKY